VGVVNDMRCIDADALEKEGWSLHRTIRVDKHTEEYQTKSLKQVPTIEPRCETCEAFNKTRLLIPQPQRKKGRWIKKTIKKKIENDYSCSECGRHVSVMRGYDVRLVYPFCHCGAEMTEGEG
jgi:transposase-like protein